MGAPLFLAAPVLAPSINSDKSALRLLSNGSELVEALLELAADHAIHIEDCVHDLADKGALAAQDPRHVGVRAIRSQREHDRVMALHRLDRVEPERNPRWRRDIDDFDTALTDLAVAGPLIARALAAVRTGIGDLDFRIGLRERIPGIHAVDVVDQRKNLFRRSADSLRALHLKVVREGRR